ALLSDSEDLGRAVFDGTKAAAAVRGKIVPRIFQERLGVQELSVDRLSIVNHSYASSIQSKLRSRTCLGWAVVSVEKATSNRRLVKIDPIPPDQLHHANIVLPNVSTEEQFDEQKQHALELAMLARWEPA